MAIPLGINLLWRVLSAVDRAPIWKQQEPAKVRAASDRRRRLIAMPIARVVVGSLHRDVRATDSSATLPDGTVLALRTYRPRGTVGDALPVVVHFHGGGWVSGDARQSEWWSSSVAARAGVVVVSVDYRLAPEHPYPAAAEDCYAAVEWVVAHASDLGVDASRLAVMGDSAGGNLAAVVCLMARDRGGPQIRFQVLIYPCVELVEAFPSEDENPHAPLLGTAEMAAFSALYRAGCDGSDPYCSPLRGHHHNLPPALIQTAQHDPLRDQGPAYASALRRSGVPVRLTNYVDAVHGYIAVPRLVPAARQALAEVVAVLQEALKD